MVLVFLATVSVLDGEDFLVGIFTAILRTIFLTPWAGTAFFLLLLSCAPVDLEGERPSEMQEKAAKSWL